MQAVATANKDLSQALSGVVLTDAERDMLAKKLDAAADKKLGDLLQVSRLSRWW